MSNLESNKLSGIECFWCKCKHLNKISENKYICKACGNVNYNLSNDVNLKFMLASTYLSNYEYSNAYKIYQELSDSTDELIKIQALYGKLLSYFGVTYIKDYNNNFITTFSNYDPDYSSISESSYYKDIINSKYKDEYYEKLEKLDTEYKKIRLELEKNNEYDVFICTKISLKTKENPTIEGLTQDSKIANSIYDELIKKGLKVFYSEKTLSGIEYDAQIYEALMRSKNILIIGSKREYLESPWVQSECERWINFINKNLKEKKSLYLFVPNNVHIELPLKLTKAQIFNNELELINRLITNINYEDKISTENNIEKLLREASIEMSFGNYDKAEEINKGLCHNTDDYRPWLNLVNIMIKKNISISDDRYLNFLNRAMLLAPNKKKEIENKYKEFLDEDIKKNEEKDKEEARKIDNEIYRLFYLYDLDVSIADIKSFKALKKRIGKLKKKNNPILKYCKNIKLLDSISRNMDNIKEKLKKKDNKVKDKSKIYNYKNKEGNKINKKIITNIVLVVLASLILFISISIGVNKESWSRYLIIGSGILLTNIVIYIFLKYNELDIVLEILQIILLGLSFVFTFIFSKEFGFYSLVLVLCSLVESALNFENAGEISDGTYEATTFISIFTLVVFFSSFVSCYGFKDFNYSNLKLIEYNGESREVVEIESGTITIASGAFLGHDEILEIVIPESVTTIESLAFSGCEGLKSIFIPENVATIGDGVFSDCSGLTEIIVDDENPYYKSIDGVLYNKDCSMLIQYPAGKKDTLFSIFDGTEIINYSAFRDNIYLTNIIMSNSVTTISERAFYGCININIININKSIKNIKSDAFYACSNIKVINYDGTIEEWNNIIIEDVFLINNLNNIHFNN